MIPPSDNLSPQQPEIAWYIWGFYLKLTMSTRPAGPLLSFYFYPSNTCIRLTDNYPFSIIQLYAATLNAFLL